MLLKKLGKYEIINWIGGGRFGDVYLARDEILEQNFALKIARMRQEDISMLRAEAKLLVTLNHTNIVRFYNVDVIDERLVLILEFVKGGTLRDIIKEGGVDTELASNTVRQIAEALEYAHEQGVLHRDLKPENVMISETGMVKITDFGLARLVPSGALLEGVAGTPLYMAPESWTGHYDEKSDIWSLGVILYELVTGVPPFLGDALDDVRKKIIKNRPITPGVLRAGLPEFLEDLTLKCLHSNPRVRPTAREVLKILNSRGRGVRVDVGFTLPEKETAPVDLTPEQNEVLGNLDGQILLLGQAGCGKTTTLVHAVLRLAEKGVPLENILVTTFTNKAANDIKTRLRKLIDFPEYDLWLGTGHNLALRILRRDAARLDLPEDFAIQEPKRIFEDADLPAGRYRSRAVLQFIDGLKAKGIGPDEYYPDSDWEKSCLDIYRRYREYTQRHGILDYDDLIVNAVRLLEDNPDLRKFYQNRFPYVFLDELQDITPIQYRFITRLVREKFFFTGDADQAIYGWRGAERELIYRVAQDFPGTKTFSLSRSFRLPRAMLDAANNLLRRSSQAIPSASVGDVYVYAAKSEEDEIKYVVQEIQSLRTEGFDYREIAILFRLNSRSRLYENALAQAQIPYSLISGSGFLERAELKSLLDYLELLTGPTASGGNPDFSARAAALFKIRKPDQTAAAAVFERHQRDLGTLKAHTALEEVARFGAYKEEDLRNLVTFAGKLAHLNISQFLNELRLVQELDLVNWGKDAVKLLTIHSAKGLEFPAVFVVDMTEDILPMAKSAASHRDLEEERRLCYVAVTRAQKRLYLSYPKYRFGRPQTPSRFLLDMFRKECKA
jgi:DNA helicase-2/ATP-dependent DNA helicase PcrA